MKKYLAIDVGGSEIKVEVMNSELKSYYKKNIITPPQNKGLTLSVLYEEIESILDRFEIAKIGFSIPGAVAADGTINWLGAVTDFEHINFSTLIKERYGIHTEVLNDANCFALAEKWRGNSRGISNSVTIAIGTGVGAGVIINDELYLGHKSMAGELGLFILNRINKEHQFHKYIFSNCGSARYVTNLAKENNLDVNNAKDIFELKSRGNQTATEILEELYENIAIGIVNTFVSIAPEKILIGGGMTNNQEFVEEIKKYTYKIFPDMRNLVDIESCYFKSDSGKIGILYQMIK